jgi:hypothetical protein
VKSVNMMMGKSLEIEILFKESRVFILNVYRVIYFELLHVYKCIV